MKKQYLILLLLITNLGFFAQNNRIDQISHNLQILVVEQPGLDDIVESSVNEVELKEFIR